jgi:threonylcarbamoyladenosine tRNA methylthiotransferase MtaB
LLNNFEKSGLSCIYTSPSGELDEFGPAHSTDADSRTRAYFKIQDGCDYKCSFCTIPKARGLSRSMEVNSAIEEFRNLLTNGYKEIILTGVNVGDYGKSFNTDLYKLLLKLVEIPSDFRIRISSIEPNLLSDEIIQLAASNEKICKHFHIPLQSGSPEILKKMRRRYRVEDYQNVITKLNEQITDVGIGVDVIVGFPGETEDNFNETYSFLRDLDISYLHVFTYSERPGTVAIEMKPQVDIAQRRERNKKLQELSNRKKNLFYNRMIGRNLNVLFESENSNSIITGYSSNYVKVRSEFSPELINSITSVKINRVENLICSGEITATKKSVDSLAS